LTAFGRGLVPGRENPGYQASSAGNTLVNFTLVRGVAIIGATVSRQAA
jgi:hypothetical protein